MLLDTILMLNISYIIYHIIDYYWHIHTRNSTNNSKKYYKRNEYEEKDKQKTKKVHRGIYY